jgi:coatomer protein complex subunit epsilon
MDPFSTEGELIHLHNHFLQGQWQAVIDYDTSALSPQNALPARILALRAQVALGHAEDVIADVQGEKEPELVAVQAFADYVAGNTAAAVRTAEKLAATEGENATVQVLCGTVLQAADLTEEALALLSKHQGNLEAVALIVQIHLQQNRTDLALKEVQAARRWAQDSLLVNIAESWVGLRLVSIRAIHSCRIHTEGHLNSGRREIPTSILRFRRNGTSTIHDGSSESHLPSHRRNTSRPI